MPYSTQYEIKGNGVQIDQCNSELTANGKIDIDQTDQTQSTNLYAWISVFISFNVLLIVDGFIQCFGNFLEDLMDSFDTSAFNVMLCGILFNGISNAAGPLAAALINKFGVKAVLITGTLISSSMIIAGSSVKAILFFNILLGGFGALGFSFMLLTAYTLPSMWFHRQRALVSGISLAGSGACYIVYSPLIDWLVDKYSPRGALLVLAGANLHCLVLAALIWTWKAPTYSRPIKSSAIIPTEIAYNKKISIQNHYGKIHDFIALFEDIFSIYLFKNIYFYQIIFSSMCYCLVGSSMPQIFKDYSRVLKVPKSTSSLLLSLMGVSIIILKISVGIFANYIRKPVLIYMAGGCIISLVTILLPFIPRLYYAYMILYSWGTSLYLSMQTSVIAKILGHQNITSTMGYVFFIQGLTLLTVVPGFLHINEITGNYTLTLILLGIITFLGVLVMVPFILNKKYH